VTENELLVLGCLTLRYPFVDARGATCEKDTILERVLPLLAS
jgi:hypothetical protein